ncbi:hypothetical protein BJF79_44165 [Actinomadura sp. CNU-125]|nr:hypothetical protein BJF79_44165 [Actinomadura sp. CNU-125]
MLAAGGASAVAATDPPSPSASPTTSPSGTPTSSPTETPQAGTLKVDVDPAEQTAKAGEPAELTVHVAASGGTVEGVKILGFKATTTGPKPDVEGACEEPFDSATCVIGTLGEDEKETVGWKLSVPKDAKKKVEIGFTVTVTASGLEEDVSRTATVTFTVPPPAESPSPTPSPTGDDDDDGDEGSGGGESNDSGSSGSGSGSSGSSGSGSSGSGSGASGSGGSTDLDVPDYPDPSPNSSFDSQSPDVALPPLAAPSPSVAPGAVPATPQSRLRPNKSPVAQELTFERMASTQVAWLAALMVVFGLLLTQVRLGRRSAIARGRVPRGLHRRTRRGMFGR